MRGKKAQLDKYLEEMTEFFVEAFQEVVVPVLDEMNARMATKADIEVLRGDIEELKKKKDTQDERMDRHGIILEKHDKIIKLLKRKVAIA